MHIPVGIKSLALSLPSVIRTNDYYKEKYPDLVAKAEEKHSLSLMSPTDTSGASSHNVYELEMMPYLQDPFRGSVERRILSPDESSLKLECRAAKDALESAKLHPNEVDLIISSSFLPEQLGTGNAAYVARELGIKCAAWNLDATCASAPLALQTASALVQSGMYRNVLVTISCNYSRLIDEENTLSWFVGDGAGAFVVAPLEMNQGILGAKTINTSALCDQLICTFSEDNWGNFRPRLQLGKEMSQIIRDLVPEILLDCCKGASENAGITLDEIDYFIFCTPWAWYAKFCTRALGIDLDRTMNGYPLYSNMGPTMNVANLYEAARAGKISENDLVLMYGFGAASSASAIVMRWGDVALGKVPAGIS
ncbi:3-oxoacyl-ACP synthase III family protein [Brunnivagina elsteri]|uniref:3-oxoacyl-ACP synthase n=1 Tax=Brunnivagina elsteri CCALA 953 TaxID=987040 RepID=A0A2A2TPS6_9CYAN|nr:3-oxoacyl-ACP synthase III family protein [Calothrix elsteri]PAX60432.1 3-oxoacyl-ACP synthase [Calothrix elsteri CCALA 953]